MAHNVQSDHEASKKKTNREIPKRDWVRNTRSSGLVEWICKHGVGHPDHGSAEKMGRGRDIHGCDGCCADRDFPGRLKNT